MRVSAGTRSAACWRKVGAEQSKSAAGDVGGKRLPGGGR
jgi:hypothetical protein